MLPSDYCYEESRGGIVFPIDVSLLALRLAAFRFLAGKRFDAGDPDAIERSDSVTAFALGRTGWL